MERSVENITNRLGQAEERILHSVNNEEKDQASRIPPSRVHT